MATHRCIQKDFEEDFVKAKISLQDYLRRLQQWRDRYEKNLDSRPRTQPLDLLSHFLTDFQWSKFDEVEVPGQYTEVRSTFGSICLSIIKFIYVITGEEYEPELCQDSQV